MYDFRKQVRVEQSLTEIERFLTKFEEWKECRDEADEEKHQYQTQLNALRDVVTRAVGDIRQDTQNILSAGLDIGGVYDQCRLQERRLLWVRRVLWGYYRQKFDQREQSQELRELLEAADDVVWSCYKEALQQASGFDTSLRALPPIPLAYIEPMYSPQALPRDEPPGDWREKRLGNRFMADFFTQLPIPLVSLPPGCVGAPWWLVFLGHEVGHHVQHDLGLVEHFADQLYRVATDEPAPKEDGHAANRWYNWGQEIFADVFSIYTMGTSALWAMHELETLPEADMLLRKDSYPSPVARLALMAKVAHRLGLDGTAALRDELPDRWLKRKPANEYEEEWLQELAQDLAMLDKMTEAVASQPMGTLGTFEELTDWTQSDFEEYGDVDEWKDSLTDPHYNKSNPSLRSARLIVSAGLRAWLEITSPNPEADLQETLEAFTHEEQVAARQRALERLGPCMIDAIEKNRDKATRAADPRANRDVAAIAADISEQLRQTDWFEW